MGNSKAKGSQFEREISKSLSLFLTEGERDDILWRSHSSGGRFTQRIEKGLDTHGQAGDITSTHPAGDLFIETFCIELKHYSDINLWSAFTGAKEGFLDFWDQTKRQAKQSKRLPLMIVKQNYKPVLFVTNFAAKSKIRKFCNLEPKVQVYPDAYIFLFEDILASDFKDFNSMLESIS